MGRTLKGGETIVCILKVALANYEVELYMTYNSTIHLMVHKTTASKLNIELKMFLTLVQQQK